MFGLRQAHFAIIFLLIVILFAAVASITMGAVVNEFCDFYNAFITLIRVSFGHFDEVYNRIVELFPYEGALLVIMFQLLMGLLLLNILLSILVNAYNKYTERIHGEESVFESLVFYFGRQALKLKM
jgi:uncharacterized membrane protein